MTYSCSCLFKLIFIEIDHRDQLPNFLLDERIKLANKLANLSASTKISQGHHPKTSLNKLYFITEKVTISRSSPVMNIKMETIIPVESRIFGHQLSTMVTAGPLHSRKSEDLQ